MTRFKHPVRQHELLASPEMTFDFPDATDSRVGSGSDEGVGSGFDNGSPRAYAERWFTTSADPEIVQQWFRDRLLSLGWVMASDRPAFHLYQRDDDETVGVATTGSSVRVHMEIEGRWPDGSTGYRPA